MSNVNTRWNLREMFATDDEWREVLSKTMTMVDALAARKGKLAESAAALWETAKQYESIQQNLAGMNRINTEQCLCQLSSAASYQSGQSQNLSLSNRE